MAGAGPLTSLELAQKTGTTERYIREWFCAQAASGYVAYESATGKFVMPDEQAMALAVENSPAFLPGAYQIIASTILDEPTVREAFKTGSGVGWHEHNCNLFEGTERFFRPSYSAHLVAEWIPALEGDQAKLDAGGTVADVGCGYAVSTMICTPASLSQEVGLALGAQAGEARLREVVTKGGFTRFRRAAETPFYLILEARA